MNEVKHPTIKEFKNWLLARKDYKEVGLSRFSTQCPLARFMQDTYGDTAANLTTAIQVYPKNILYGSGKHRRKTIVLRRWARVFVSKIDNIGKIDYRKQKEESVQISGGEALEALNNAVRQSMQASIRTPK